MDKKTVKDMLTGATMDDLIDLIFQMTCSDDSEQVILNWCKKNNKQQENCAVQIEICKLWEEAYHIIDDFNTYGGGSDSDENTAAEHIWRMCELINQNKISWKIRKSIIDEMMEEFYKGNSGFEDYLVDSALLLCEQKEEKRYLADLLIKDSSSYYKNFAANIYEELGDDQAFLRTKLENLYYSDDYIDVAKYYAKHKNHSKEEELIWQGLKNCRHSLGTLINYITPKYIKENDTKSLRQLYEFIMQTTNDLYIYTLAIYLYKYAKQLHDYTNQKKMLLLLINTSQGQQVKKWYQLCKSEFTTSDWEAEYNQILKLIEQKDIKFYFEICMETNKEKIVLDYITTHHHPYESVDDGHYFSKMLFEKYPQDILNLYWKEVSKLVENPKNYDSAYCVLKEIKAHMSKIHQQQEWEQQLESLKNKYKRKRNFMALLKNI